MGEEEEGEERKGEQVPGNQNRENDTVIEKDAGQRCGLSLYGEGPFLSPRRTCDNTQIDEAVAKLPELEAQN